jgi:fibronectin type 3 domain-containing protein
MLRWYHRLLNRASRPVRRRPSRSCLAVEELEARIVPSISVTTYHDDTCSTGQNLSETNLTPANVNFNSFGRLFATPVDGQVYAQPLYMSGLSISGQTHNVTYVATEHDSLYAIDADKGTILWKDSFLSGPYLPAGAVVTPVPYGDLNSTAIQPEVGITGTPVIDPNTNTLYLAAKTKEVYGGNAHYVYRLHALDVASGVEKFGGPVVIGDTISNDLVHSTYVSGPYMDGTGVGLVDDVTTLDGGNPAVDGKIAFNAFRHLQRPALTLDNGVVYLAFGSHGDTLPYHGWVLGYDAQTLQLDAVFNDTPNGSEGGIWLSGGQLNVDGQGNLYFATGNGTFDGGQDSNGNTIGLDANGFPVNGDYGDSVVKLAPDPSSSATNPNVNGWGLKVVDYFTPFNQAGLNTEDTDLGSGAPVLLPDAAGSAAHPHLLVETGKEGTLYLIDRDAMGHFDANTDHVVQEIPNAVNRSFDTPAYFNNTIYYVGAFSDVAKAYSITNGLLSSTPTSESSDGFGYPGSTPAISANGTSNGLVWDLDKGTNQLRAYDASTYANELYTSAQAPFNRDQLGTVVKFTVPTIANGTVYVGTTTSLVAYGLLSVPTTPPDAPSNLTATAVSSTQVNLTWQNNADNQNGFYIEESTDGMNFTQVATVSVNATSYTVGHLQPFTVYTFRVRAFNSVGNSDYSAPASAATPTGVGSGGLDFGNGFTKSSRVHLNGSAILAGTKLQLTNNKQNLAASAFSTSTVSIKKFSTQFNFQLTGASGGGFTFAIQPASPSALGTTSAGLGYAGVGQSVAVKFDLYDDAGEGYDSTGLYLNGASPTVPAVDLSNSGIDLHSGDVFNVGMNYDGATLTVTLTDTTTNVTVTQAYAVDIPGTVGSGMAFVGFTAGTGSHAATQDILSWTFTPLAVNPPAAPSALTATATAGTQVNLSWTDNSNNETGFLIERKTGAGGDYGQVATVKAGSTSYIDTALSTGTEYFYRVRATNTAGDSAYSNEADVITPSLPATPSSLQASAVTSTEIDLAWQDNADNEDGYDVFRQTGGSGDYSLLASLPADTTSYADLGLSAGTLYDYHVQAFNLAGFSGVADFSVTAVTAAPTNVTATAGNGQITLSWSAPMGAASYNIYRSTTGRGAEGATPFQTGVTVPSFTDTGLTNGSTYYYEISAVDSGGESSLSSEASATAGKGVAVSFDVSGFPSSTTAGTAGNVTVTVLDALGSTVTDYTGTVHFTSSDGQAVLPPDYTFGSGDSGVHTFSATLATAGSQSLTATDTLAGSVSGTETGIAVSPAAASTFVVSGFPSPDTAGVLGSLTVMAEDAFGNTASGYTGTVHLMSTDPLAWLSANYTFKAADKGVHRLHAVLKTAGTETITAQDTQFAGITGAQSGIVVNPAAAQHFKFGGFPSVTVAGAAHPFTLTVTDTYGNIATGYLGTVTFGSGDTQAMLPADYTFSATDAGVHTFSGGAMLKTAGVQSLTVTDTAVSTLTSTRAGITVKPAAASSLQVSGFPMSVTAGVAYSFTVTALDAYGNIAIGYHGTVRFTSSDAAAVLPANYAFTSSDSGVHTCSATLPTPGTQSLTATTKGRPSVSGTESGITVSAAPRPGRNSDTDDTGANGSGMLPGEGGSLA